MPGSEQLFWVPIRHHSPLCSWHLNNYISQIKPDCILIEGPSDANFIIPQLHHKSTKPPVSLYIFAKKKQGTAQQDPGAIRCYLPFAEISPEWNALQSAKRLKKNVEFIDLPYSLYPELQNNNSSAEYLSEPLLYNESHITQQKLIQHLKNVENCNSFDEWWDRHFETGVQHTSANAYFEKLYQFGALLREAEKNVDHLTLTRESHMAENIQRHLEAGKRCVVVCGAFHCKGIEEQLQSLACARRISKTKNAYQSQIYLIPYSLARLNSASGYASGLSDCGYYQHLWQSLKGNNHWANPVTHQISLCAQLTQELKSRNFAITTSDIIESAALSQRLAELRGINTGRTEFKDAMETAVVKLGNSDAFRLLMRQVLAGKEIGKIPRDANSAPILEDFHQQCKRWKLPIQALNTKERALEIYRKSRHREISQLLHQLCFLGIPYAIFHSGPNFSKNKDLKKVREVWQLQWRVETSSQLTECSHLGDTLKEAALTLLYQHLRDANQPGHKKVALLLQALSMGFQQTFSTIVAAVNQWLQVETEVIYLCEALNKLVVAYYSRSVLLAQDLPALENILEQCFLRICQRLPWLALTQEEDCETICHTLLDMRALLTVATPWCDSKSFYQSLDTLLQQEPPPMLAGVCCGMLMQSKQHSDAETQSLFAHYFGDVSLSPTSPGEFLRGFLIAERSRFLREPSLQKRVSEFLLSLDELSFLDALPSLRWAFTYLNPQEKLELSQSIHGKSVSALPRVKWTQRELQHANRLRDSLYEVSKLWGLDNGK